MERHLLPVDYIVFGIYFIIVAGYGYWIYHRKKKTVTDTKDFFLAEGSLTWWAIGASLIASDISAEVALDPSMFRLNTRTTVLVVVTLILLTLLYIRFW